MFDKLFYVFLFLTLFFEITAQYLYKLIYKNNLNNFYIIIGTIFYALTGFFTFKILKYQELITINIIWHLLHFLILFLIGYFIFKEKLNLNKKIACIFGFISLILFMIEGHVH